MKSSHVTAGKEANGYPTGEKHIGLVMMDLTNGNCAPTEKEWFCGPEETCSYYSILDPLKIKSSNNTYGREVLL